MRLSHTLPASVLRRPRDGDVASKAPNARSRPCGPEGIDPERFTEQRREHRLHKNIWMPFGGGVHKRIGLHFAGVQVKAILHQLLQRYS